MKNLFVIFRRIRTISQKQRILLIFLLLVLSVFSAGMFQGTLGMFSQSSVASDTAVAAKFDVIITPPEEFVIENNEVLFNHWFLSDFEIKGLNFKVYNNGETDIICTPYINDDVKYRIFVSGIERKEFVVKTKESLIFLVLIASDGFSALSKDVKLFIDVRQLDY